MASPIVNRLQQQRNNIHRMLLPGLHSARVSEQNLAPLSPVQEGIGGAKYQLAARKMRSLDPERMGLASNDTLQSFSKEIIQKFQNPELLLHLAPPSAEPSGMWSQVETVFPTQAKGTREAPPQPGEMRAGSIIPRMPMFPKPGQSIESFKEQVRQRPQTPVKPTETPKPRIGPNTRLFSRVQEITTKKPAQDDDQPDIPEIVQRQPDVSQAAHQGPDAEPPSVDPPLPTVLPPAVNISKPELTQFAPPASSQQEPTAAQATPTPVLPPTPERNQPAKAQPPAEEKAPEMVHLAKPVERAIPPQPEQVLKKATPVPQRPKTDKPSADLPRALPAPRPERKAKTPPKSPHPARQDIAKAEAKPAPVQQPPLESRKPVLPLASQEKQSASVAKPESPIAAEPQLPELRAIKSTDGEAPSSQPPIDAAPAQQPVDSSRPEIPVSTPPAEEMPLQKQVVSRRKSSAKLKTITPQRAESHLSVPTSLHIEKPLLSLQKYRSAPSVVARQPDESNPEPSSSQPDALRQLLEHFQPAPKPQGWEQKPELGQPQLSPAPAEMSPIPMSLAYPPRSMAPAQQPESAPQTIVPTSQPPVSQPLAQKTTLPTAAVRPGNVRNTIQRRWPEHPDPGDHIVSSGSGGGSGSEQAGGSALDLNQLAEDVFPYIKRLIENESDRLSSRFH